MPGQFKQYVRPLFTPDTGLILTPRARRRIQDDYAREFHSFKPDKKLRWLPLLGTIHLEIELEDRTVPADVPPLEAAFIELFSARGERIRPLARLR